MTLEDMGQIWNDMRIARKFMESLPFLGEAEPKIEVLLPRFFVGASGRKAWNSSCAFGII